MSSDIGPGTQIQQRTSPMIPDCLTLHNYLARLFVRICWLSYSRRTQDGGGRLATRGVDEPVVHFPEFGRVAVCDGESTVVGM